MMRNLRWLLPGSISGQITIIIALSLVVIHSIVTFGMISDHHQDKGPPGPSRDLIRLIDGTDQEDRPRLLTQIARALPQYEFTLLPAGKAGLAWRDADRDHGAADPGARAGGGRFDEAIDGHTIRLADGQGLVARLAPPPRGGPPSRGAPPPGRPWSPIAPLQMSLLSLAIIMTLLGAWVARVLTAPLRAFTDAAETFNPDAEIAPLAEGGPEEIRTAARALNRMRGRIKTLVDDRMRMLAAVGHDLRTPITRLRLRSEFIDNMSLRGQMLDDLAQMTDMVESVLVFLREGRSPEDTSMIDVAISLKTICDQFADTGSQVSYDGPDHVTLRAHACSLNRAVTNLVENAVRYGGGGRVRLAAAPNSVVIAVEDEGPGIPDGRKEAMMEPFVRGDAARGMDGRSGFGLGLSIARAIAAAHGGSLTLLNREPKGLIARIELPVVKVTPMGALPHGTTLVPTRLPTIGIAEADPAPIETD
jgi:signal transduction histidine kinase